MLFMQLARLTLVPPLDSDAILETHQPVAGSLSRPSRWSKRRKKRFAVDGEEGPQGLIVRQDELEDAPDDQLPPLFMVVRRQDGARWFGGQDGEPGEQPDARRAAHLRVHAQRFS